MRTTITLDDDVAVAIEQRRREEGLSLRDAINSLLRLALARSAEVPYESRFRTRSVRLGGSRLPDLDDIAAVLAVIEGEAHS
jgi:hypothetical protein